ncbi:MAG: sterol-binding protein [Solirubrobacterales bacterium]|nr:sterol-binding protein [Solirubrobacterales bacterium]
MTATLPTTQSPLDNISYEDLYRRWENGNWKATAIDFSTDAEQWRSTFTEFERKAAYWNYCLFFWGEDAVADGLSPYVDAAPLEEQKYFLTTQQVDEARHAVFFNRFMTEVAGLGGASAGANLTAIKPELTWGFKKVFGRLETMCDELRANPSIPQLAAGVALYHIIIEATLAQPGQHFITSYLEDRDLLPGFREGMANVAADEQRHIGFGVKLLSDLRKMDPEVPHAVADLLREVMPWTINVLVPPGWDERYIETFGFTMEDLGEEGASSLETKLRTAGLALEDLPGPPVMPMNGTPRERAIRGKVLCKAGYLGEKIGPPSREPAHVELLFESVANGLDTAAAREPGVIQWEFTDHEPWHLVVDNGTTRAARGVAESPRVRFQVSFEDWVDVVAGRTDPRRLALRGRFRPRGDLRWLFKSRKMFPAG